MKRKFYAFIYRTLIIIGINIRALGFYTAKQGASLMSWTARVIFPKT